MRTTLTIDPDVAQAIEALRRRSGLGLKRTINELLRAGLASRADGAQPPVGSPTTPSSCGRLLIEADRFDDIGTLMAEMDVEEAARLGDR